MVSKIVLAASLLLSATAQATEPEYLDRMDQEHAGDTPVASPAAEAEPRGETAGEEVAYAEIDGKTIRGYLARPSATAHAGLIVIQEWWGLNDNIRAMADRLAGEGYVALAVDLYEGESATDREGASRLARQASERSGRLEENLRQAHRYLKSEVGVAKVGVIGWCFGGGWSLRTALMMGREIDVAVMYYGRVITDSADLQGLHAPLLGIFGELDQGIPVDQVRQFESALASLGKEADIHIYQDADHAFANPSGSRYNASAAEDAWETTLLFLAEHLGE